MQTFQYIKGNKVKNAVRYKLFKKSNDTYYDVATQEILQIMDIAGTIGSNGSPAETASICPSDGSVTITPITKTTGDGRVHYIKVSGEMRVTMDDTIGSLPGNEMTYEVPFEGTLNVSSSAATSFSYTTAMTKKGTGIYLTTSLGDIKVYEIGTTIIDSVEVYGGSILVYGAHTQYRRTDFIPIESLTDDLYNACVGVFARDEQEILAYKIAFYSEIGYSTFLKGVTYADIVTKFGAGKQYLTVAEIKQLAEDTPTAKYVIFSSHTGTGVEDSNSDYVSIGNIYFPLFRGYDALSGDGPHTLVVKAIGDGTFFADSEYSEPVTYTKVSS